MVPPLRDQTNVDALWLGISRGQIDTIGSDHAPHLLEEKTAEDIWRVKVGIPGLETTLPIILTLVKKDRLQLDTAMSMLSEKPAAVFKLKDKGHIEENYAADLVIVDFKKETKIYASKFKSKAKFSPFNNWKISGKPTKTFVNGSLIMEDGEIIAKRGAGAVVRRERD
jgi:dihydroorotase